MINAVDRSVDKMTIKGSLHYRQGTKVLKELSSSFTITLFISCFKNANLTVSSMKRKKNKKIANVEASDFHMAVGKIAAERCKCTLSMKRCTETYQMATKMK